MNTAKLKLANGEAVLYRGVKLMDGARHLGTGDHMVLQHYLGNSEDVMVLEENGKLRAKRLLPQMRIQSPSPAIKALVESGHALVELPAEQEKRFLTIYNMFPKET